LLVKGDHARRDLNAKLIGALAFSVTIGWALIWLGACAPTPIEDTPTPSAQVMVRVFVDYVRVPHEQVIDESDAIFVGQVIRISPTQWNQDNGEYWKGGLPVHFIEVERLQTVVDTIGLDQKVTLTELSYSPLDDYADYFLEAGQRALFYIVQVEIAWRSGLKTALRLTSYPPDSFVILGDDRYPVRPTDEAARLKKLIQEIAERRETLIQP
jgi:hypothetical protein